MAEEYTGLFTRAKLIKYGFYLGIGMFLSGVVCELFIRLITKLIF